MKRKIINTMRKVLKSIFLGFCDALLPYIKESIKEKDTLYISENPKLEIDWTRLTSALLSFTLIILAIFDFITADDILKFLTALNSLLQ